MTIELWNLLNPDWPRTSEIYELDASLEERFRRTRLTAELAGEVVGVVDFGTNPGSYHPQKFGFELYVHPDHHGQGIGKALYGQMLEVLEPLNPLSLSIGVRENQVRAVRFFQDRGYAETKRNWVSVLEVSKVNLSPFQNLDIGNIRIQTFAELSAADPQANAKLHELFSDIRIDTPRSEPATPISLEFFEANILDSSDYDPEAFFIALDQERWIGMSCMYRVGETKALDHWFTGTRRSHRGRGIALALKVRTVQYAQAGGFSTIRTDNDSLNAPMLAINKKLGFVRGAAQISMRKVLSNEQK
jgi:GNAT superfamily N-acetyltransferase